MAMRHVLVIKLGALGDVLLAQGALADLRRFHAGARITLLTRRAYAGLMAGCPWIDAIAVDPHPPRWRLDRWWRLRGMLRGLAAEAVYDLQDSSRSRIYRRWFAGIPWHPLPGCGNALERLAAGLASAGVPCVSTLTPDTGWLAANVSDLTLPTGAVVLLPGSSAKHVHKRWPGYAALATRLVAAGYPVLTVPGPDELDACRNLPGRIVVEADGRPLSIPRLAGVLRQAAVAVGNDSGPTHLAAHLGVATVALFGAHAPAASTGIGRPWVRILEHPDLSGLTVDAVATLVMASSLPGSRSRPG